MKNEEWELHFLNLVKSEKWKVKSEKWKVKNRADAIGEPQAEERI